MCALTRAFQWALVRPLEMKTRCRDMTSGLTTAIATSTLSRETPTKETPETAETHIETRLKLLWVRIGETLKRLRWTSVGRWRLAWVSGARRWVLGSNKAANTTTATSALSRETPTKETPETAETHVEKRLPSRQTKTLVYILVFVQVSRCLLI